MKVIFTFALDTDTGEAVIAGNIPAPAALQLLQQVVIADAIQAAARGNADEEGKKKEVKEDATSRCKNKTPN